jgi:hypothetical protein
MLYAWNPNCVMYHLWNNRKQSAKGSSYYVSSCYLRKILMNNLIGVNRPITSPFIHFPKLQYLNVENCNISKTGQTPFTKLDLLRKLNINNNPLSAFQ